MQDRTCRLVATARLRDPVLLSLVESDELHALAEIESATSGRLRAQAHGADRLDRRELVHGIPHANIVNAAFSYWLPKSRNRFNGPGRGAWYAALALETCVAEVSFHIERELANIADFTAVVDYAEMFASFIGNFVDLREVSPRPKFLDPDPAESYGAGNRFAESVSDAGHYGIVYASLRHPGGTCFVALLPHAVQSVTQGRVIRLAWTGKPGPTLTELSRSDAK
ncbi:MAG TPA: RES family NAD+ phosphorylase [Xanthobacteraceae bacterium]